jgi:hypothetical protein
MSSQSSDPEKEGENLTALLRRSRKGNDRRRQKHNSQSSKNSNQRSNHGLENQGLQHVDAVRWEMMLTTLQQIQQSSGENAVRLETVSNYLHQLQQTTLHVEEAQTADVPNSPLPTPSTETCTSIINEYILRFLVVISLYYWACEVIRVGHMMLVDHFPEFMFASFPGSSFPRLCQFIISPAFVLILMMK